MNEIRKSRCGSFTAIVFAAFGIYLLSFGPALWIVQRGFVSARTVAKIYQPWLALEFHAPQIVQDAATAFAGVFQAGSALTRVREAPLWGTYSVGDLAYRLIDDRKKVDALAELQDYVVSTIEPDTWDEVGGVGKLRGIPETRSIQVWQTRRVHAALATSLAELRAIKQSKQHVRELDLIALLRIERQSSTSGFRGCGRELKEELLARAIVVHHTDNDALVDTWRSFSDVAQLLAFLDRQPRDTLRRGVFWDGSHSGPEPDVADRLRAYCRSADIDLFIEWPFTGFGFRSGPPSSPEIKWEVHASDSEYAL